MATDLPEIRRIIHGEKIGLVGDTSSPEKLAALIDDFFSDEHRLIAWKARVAFTRQQFCWEQEEQKLVNVFEALR